MRTRSLLTAVACALAVVPLAATPASASEPTVTLSPTSGPIGTRVDVDSDCSSSHTQAYLTVRIAREDNEQIRLTEETVSNGWFTIPPTSDEGPTQPAVYVARFTCHITQWFWTETYDYEPVTFTVTASAADVTPPVWTVPTEVTVPATGPRGARVTYAASAADPESQVVSQYCSPSSGSTFAVGTTTVRCSAYNAYHLEASASFPVTVDGSGLPPATHQITAVGEPTWVTTQAGAVGSDGSVVLAAIETPGAMWSAHRWVAGTTQRLDDTPGPSSSGTHVVGTNGVGQAVGESRGSAVRWAGTSASVLGQGVARDVNESGHVVGDLQSGGHLRPFLHAAGNTQMLDIGNADRGSATAANDSGVIVGSVHKDDVYAEPDPDWNPWNPWDYQQPELLEAGYQSAARWVGGVLARITIPNVSASTTAQDVSEAGAVLVRSTSASWIWTDGGPVVSLPAPAGYGSFWAHRMNEAHQVVGTVRNNFGTIPVLYTPGKGSVDLQGLIPHDAGWRLFSVSDINDAGQIVGSGSLNGVSRAFLMEPIASTPADVTPPTINLTAPADGAAYSQGQAVTAAYSCDDGAGSGVTTCAGPVAAGAALDTSSAGPHTFTVSASDAAGNTTSSTATYQVLAGNAAAQLTGAGGTVTTDPGGVGATPDVPVQTAITVPAGLEGTLTIAPTSDASEPTGFALLGQSLSLKGPAATAEVPYVVSFTLDASAAVGADGQPLPPAGVQVFRDGVAVGDCTDPAAAVPDPCVAERVALADGDIRVVVRTSAFSTWSLARLDYAFSGLLQPVAAPPTVNAVTAGSAVPVKFSLGGDRGFDVFAAGAPTSVARACTSGAADAVSGTTSTATSKLTYDAASQTYNYIWKTDRAWAGSCRVLTLTFRDGSKATASFAFRK